jgi:hypothetical protein
VSVSQQAAVFLISWSYPSHHEEVLAFLTSAFRDESFETQPIQAGSVKPRCFSCMLQHTWCLCFIIHFPCSAPNPFPSDLVSVRERPRRNDLFLFLRFPLFYIIFHDLGGELSVVRYRRHIWGGKLMSACLCTGRKRKFLRRLLHPGAFTLFLNEERLSNPISGILTSFDRLVD